MMNRRVKNCSYIGECVRGVPRSYRTVRSGGPVCLLNDGKQTDGQAAKLLTVKGGELKNI
jgi:hypothetical protein